MYEDEQWKDLLTSFDGQTITYDEIGNPLTYRDGMSFAWEKGRQLKQVTKADETVSYQYNSIRLTMTQKIFSQYGTTVFILEEIVFFPVPTVLKPFIFIMMKIIEQSPCV